MDSISWDTPTLYSYLTNITNAGHVVPVLNGKHATPKWDTLSLKYKYKAHSVSYVIVQSNWKKIPSNIPPKAPLQWKYADMCISILMESIIQHLHTPQNFSIMKMKEIIRMRY